MHSPTRASTKTPTFSTAPCCDRLSALRPFSDYYMVLPRGITTALPAASAVEPSDSPIMPGTVLFPQLAFLEHNKLLWVTNCVMFCSSGLRMLCTESWHEAESSRRFLRSGKQRQCLKLKIPAMPSFRLLHSW